MMSFYPDLRTPGSLAMPDGDKAEVWLSITGTLFGSVQAALAGGQSLDFGGLRTALETWQSFCTSSDGHRSQWEAAHRLLWCAEHCQTVPEIDRDQMARLVNQDSDQNINNHAGWIWNCTSLLQGLRTNEASISVPIALSDENSESLKATGTVAKLVLDILRPGTGQLFHHPADSIAASTSDDFSSSMHDAWVAARSQLDDDGEANHCDGRWRVLLRDGQPVSEISGPSASGAATAGWDHLCNGRIYDDGVIVLLQVNSKGELSEVSGVEAKVRAVTRANRMGGRIDTIVVAGERNEHSANHALETLKISNILVVNIKQQPAKQLASLRSQLAGYLLGYLQKVITNLRTIEQSIASASDVSKEAYETLAKLQTQAAAVTDLPVFVLVDLSKLARISQRDPAIAITDYLHEQYRLDLSLCRWLQGVLPTDRCRLMVYQGGHKPDEVERSQLMELLETIGTQQWNLTNSIVLDRSDLVQSDQPLSLLRSRDLVRIWFAPFLVVRERNPDFAGRKIVLENLRHALTVSGKSAVTQRVSAGFANRQAVSGLGGIGKTAVAVEYAYRFRTEYDAVFFVRADQGNSVREDYELICAELSLSLKPSSAIESDEVLPHSDSQKDYNRVVRAVLNWLNTHSNWLLIFDNVENPTQVSSLLPRLQRGHIIFTSRSSNFRAVGIENPIVLSELDKQESEDLLWKRRNADRRIAGSSEQQAAAELVRVLTGLPLALEQAAALMRECNYSFAEYLDLWRERRTALFDYKEAVDASHPDTTVVTTFALAFAPIEKHALTDVRFSFVPGLLRMMAFLNPDVVSFDLLVQCLKQLGDHAVEDRTAIAPDVLLKELLSMPRSFSLIEVHAETRTCGMHRLVQEVLRSSMSKEECRSYARKTILALDSLCSILSIDYGNWLEAVPAQAHAYAIASILLDPFHRNHFDFDEVAELLTKTGLLLNNLGRPEDAEPLLARAEELRDHTENLDLAETLCYRADALADSGDHEAAREKYHRALAIRLQILGEWAKDVGQLYNNLGLSYFYSWDNEQAETYYQKARETWQHSGDPVLIGSALHNLALLHKRLHKSDTESLLREATAKLETKFRHDDMVATVWHHLGDYISRSSGEHVEGEQYLRKARLLREKLLGEDSPKLVPLLNDHADALQKLGKHDEAEKLRARAREIRRRNE